MSSEVRLSIKNFNELGKDLNKSLSKDRFLKELYDELKTLESRRGSRGMYLGKKILAQLYFPDRGDIFLGTFKLKPNPHRRTGQFDANVIIQNYIHKKDTRKNPVFFSAGDYDAAEEYGELKPRIEIFRVLSREPRLMYYKHRGEEEE